MAAVEVFRLRVNISNKINVDITANAAMTATTTNGP